MDKFGIQFRERFTTSEAAYWKQYGISGETIKRFNVKSVISYIIEKGDQEYTITATDDDPIFAYVINEDCIKLYRPLNDRFKFVWLGAKPEDYVFGIDQLPDKGEGLIICAGEKDTIVLSQLGYNAICLNSETSTLKEELVSQLEERFDHVSILYDIDNTGMVQSTKWSNQYGVNRIVLPEILKPYGKDVSDYARQIQLETDGFTFDNLSDIITKPYQSYQVRKYDEDEQIVNRTEYDRTFPVEIFPDQLQKLITEANETLGFPIDFFASSILVSSAIAIGNTYRIQVKRGWYENPSLFLALVGRPGTNKSHPLSYAFSPFERLEQEEYSKYKNDLLQYEEAKNEGYYMEKPRFKQFLVNDFTPESISSIHINNPRGIGVVKDELVGWFNDFNKYRKGSDEEFWLSTWSGKSNKVNRKSSDVIMLNNPCISVIGTIQPSVLKELGKGNRNSNGFIDRILFSYPEIESGNSWCERELTDQVENYLDHLFCALIKKEVEFDEYGKVNPTTITYSKEGRDIFVQWFNQINQLKKSASDTEINIYSKLEIYFSRLALILELIKKAFYHSEGLEISKGTVEETIKLIEYFKFMALKVRGSMSKESHVGDKFTEAKQLRDSGWTHAEIGDRFGVSEGAVRKWLKTG